MRSSGSAAGATFGWAATSPVRGRTSCSLLIRGGLNPIHINDGVAAGRVGHRHRLITREHRQLALLGDGRVFEDDPVLSLPQAYIVADACGVIAATNPAGDTLLGYATGMLVGRPLVSLMPARMTEDHRAGFSRYVTTGESRIAGRPVRVPALRADGSEVEIDLVVRGWRTPEGELVVLGALLEPGAERAGLLRLENELAKRALTPV